MAATLTIRRAGTYQLDVLVDGLNVIGSPYKYLEITPTAISAANCVPQNVPTTIYAGFEYSFLIQARDADHNNLVSKLAVAAPSNSAYLNLGGSNIVTGTITDYSSNGVFKVSFNVPKSVTPGSYTYKVYF